MKTGRKEEGESFTTYYFLITGNCMAGCSSSNGDGSSSRITLAWSLRSEPTLKSDEEPPTNKPLEKYGRGTGIKGVQ